MRVLVKLYNMVDAAADGSTIPREQTEAYLNSPDYRTIIKDKVALCGFTHKDRVLLQQYKNVIGPDDQVLVNGNYIGYISKIFVKDNDKYCYAYITVFDPDDFSGSVRDNIINFRGLMKQEIKLPSSVVIQAMWAPNGKAERIIRIKGMDFTQNPSFKGSGTVKTMSVVDKGITEDDTKLFSLNDVPQGCNITTKLFSLGEVQVESVEDDEEDKHEGIHPDAVEETKELSKFLNSKKSFSRSDIVSFFGLNSDIAKATKNYSDIKVEELRNIIDKFEPFSNTPLETAYHILKQDIVDTEDDKLKEFIKNHKEQIEEIMKEVGDNKTDMFIFTKPKLVELVIKHQGDQRLFSTVRSIQDRMMASKYPKFAIIKRVLDNYRFYYDVNKDNMDNEDLRVLSSLLKEDLKWLISLASEKIYNGGNLSNYYQLIRFGETVFQSGVDLSKIYRRVMISEKVLGFIPQSIYEKWSEKLTEFYNNVNSYVFGNLAMEVYTIDKI